jgi:hypothetical protein
MEAGRKRAKEQRDQLKAKAAAEVNAMIAKAKLEVERARIEAKANEQLAKAQAKLSKAQEQVRVGFLNPVHEAFNYYGSVRGGYNFALLASIQFSTEAYKDWISKLFPNLLFVGIEGYDYGVVLFSRKHKQFITLLAKDGTINICGYIEPEQVSDELWAEIKMLSGGLQLALA